MALIADRGQLYTWGVGDYGKLGHGDTTPQARGRVSPYPRLGTPLFPPLLRSLARASPVTSCAFAPQLLPRHLEYFRLMKLVFASGGAFHSAACTDSGTIYTWGGGTYGKLGQSDTMNSLTPRPVKSTGTGAHFVQVECGTFHTIALSKLGDVFTFGFNGNGRLGLAAPRLLRLA